MVDISKLVAKGNQPSGKSKGPAQSISEMMLEASEEGARALEPGAPGPAMLGDPPYTGTAREMAAAAREMAKAASELTAAADTAGEVARQAPTRDGHRDAVA